MRDLALLATGLFVGMLVMAAVVASFLQDRQAAERTRLAVALRAERVSRCARGQHREVLETGTPHMYLWCADCPWREEVGIAYQTGTNRKTRPAA